MNAKLMEKLLAVGISVCGSGGIILYSLQNSYREKFKVNAVCQDVQVAKWDYNWDKRQPETVVPPLKGNGDLARYNKDVQSATPTAVRNIILVRHGQQDSQTGLEGPLSQLGKQQAKMTGKRLKELGYNYKSITASIMKSALESACIIKSEAFPSKVEISHDLSLLEGEPIAPDPPLSVWVPPPKYYEDGARIEEAFRKYFHRAEPKQKKDTYEVIVCPANIIRFFLCRALQFPPQAWFRIALHNSSISMLSILPSGTVMVRSIDDTGHLSRDLLTYS